jgi:peroxiredoxin Q/BCP
MTDPADTGDLMPDLALESPDGSALRPSDFRGRKLVLFFYPKDDTPGCTVESKDFSALLPEFAAAGTAVLGVSKDPPAKHQKFAAKHALSVPLATDADPGLSDALGVSAPLTSSTPRGASPASGAR